MKRLNTSTIFKGKVKMEEYIIWTFCNYGYREYAENLYENLKKYGKKLVIYCLDDESCEYFEKKGIDTYVKYERGVKNEIIYFGEAGFNNLCKIKFEITNKLNEKGINQIYIDGDIYFLKDVFDEIIELCEMYDYVIQNDMDNPKSRTNHCTGFYGIKGTSRGFVQMTKGYMSSKSADQKIYRENYKKYWKNVNVCVLDRYVYINGAVLKEYGIREETKMVHFNYIIGNEKKEIMKEKGCWKLN